MVLIIRSMNDSSIPTLSSLLDGNKRSENIIRKNIIEKIFKEAHMR